jgi:glycosyltransferase involved in cell wall biosynthesis
VSKTVSSNHIKRILVVCQHFYPESFRINEICESLMENGYEVDILCGIPNYPQGKFYKGYHYFHPRRENYKGMHIMRVGEIPQWKKGGMVFVALNYLWFPFASLFHMPRLFLKKKYDIIFIFGLSPVFMGFPGIIYSILRRVRSLYYIQDYWPDSLYSVIPLKNKILRWLLKKFSFWHYQKTGIVLAPSKGVLEKVRMEAQIPAERTSFLPMSCSKIYETLVYNADLHTRFGDRFNLIFAGNIGPAQSLETLAEAVMLLKKSDDRFAESFRVILLGDGMARTSLERKVEALGVSDCFAFEGFVSTQRVLEYHELADALFVSLSDDPLFSVMLPVKTQHYMAAGKPLLAALNGEGAAVVREAGCGVVCPSGHPELLADALQALLSYSPEKREELGANGKRYYEANYRHELFMERLIAYLEKGGNP